jgi:uncharacterized membrane protein YgcG
MRRIATQGMAWAALGMMLGSAGAQAQEVPPADAARAKAGIIIATYDDLAGRCDEAGGFSGAQRAEIDAWKSRQEVDKVRAHLDGGGLSPALRGQVQAAAKQIIQQVASNAPPCAAAVSLTRTNDAQFAAQLPQLLAGSTNPPANKPASKAPATATAPAAAAFTAGSANAARLASEIEGFGFDSCTRIGYGGMVMFAPCPVVLFRNGNALTDVEGLNHAQGMLAHRQQNPDDWTRWRRSGERIQLEKKDGWKNITYTAVYSALPKNFRLDGRYHSSSGTGNTAMGGGQAVIAWSDYVFTPDGRVQRDGGAGGSSTGSGASVTTASTAASRSGRYRIDGLLLAIDYDDGSKERRVIIADPRDEGKGTMWLDGEGYVYKK